MLVSGCFVEGYKSKYVSLVPIKALQRNILELDLYYI